MNILYIYAHPNSKSFNSKLKKCGIEKLQTNGHKIKISDLYEMNFNPVASWNDFKINSDQTQYFLAQNAAYQQQALAEDIVTEIDKIKWADHLIFQFPLWWFSVPVILKGWFDRVLVKGFAYDTGKIMRDGLLKGKKASLILTTQSPESAYQVDGIQGATIETFLYPVHHTLNFAGIETTEPFIIHGAFNLDKEQQQKILRSFKFYLSKR